MRSPRFTAAWIPAHDVSDRPRWQGRGRPCGLVSKSEYRNDIEQLLPSGSRADLVALAPLAAQSNSSASARPRVPSPNEAARWWRSSPSNCGRDTTSTASAGRGLPRSLRLTWDKSVLEPVETAFPEPQREKYKFTDKPISVFTGNFEIQSRFKVARWCALGAGALSGKLRYQACTETLCLPPKTVEFKMAGETLLRAACAGCSFVRVQSGCDRLPAGTGVARRGATEVWVREPCVRWCDSRTGSGPSRPPDSIFWVSTAHGLRNAAETLARFDFHRELVRYEPSGLPRRRGGLAIPLLDALPTTEPRHSRRRLLSRASVSAQWPRRAAGAAHPMPPGAGSSP